MKRYNFVAKIVTALMSSAVTLSYAPAQTILSGDHVVEGNLEVGTALQKGGLTVTGETGNAASPGIKVTGDGGVIFEGTPGQGSMPVVAPDAHCMMWYPGKGAFKIGYTGDFTWDSNDIGADSVALGWLSIASGERSTALRGWASGTDSTAIHGGAMALGESSIALNGGEAYGFGSMVMSGGVARGTYSIAMGLGELSSSEARGNFSIAMNGGVTDGAYSIAMSGGDTFGTLSTGMSLGSASGDYSTAMAGGIAAGDFSTAMSGGWAHGDYSTAANQGEAFGNYSTAISGGQAYGYGSIAGGWVVAQSLGCSVFGYYNTVDENESSSTWVETDPIFIIGNGTGDWLDAPEVRNRNAMVVRKNGDLEVYGNVKMPRQGDILMGEFGEAEP